MTNIDIVQIICKALDKQGSLITYVTDGMICVMLLMQLKFTVNRYGYLKLSLLMVLKRLFGGIWITVIGGKPSFLVSTRITIKKCTAIADEFSKEVLR